MQKLTIFFMLFFMILPITGYSRDTKELVVAIGGESTEGYDPVTGWGRYGNPLFQSTLLKRDNDLKIVKDLAASYRLRSGILLLVSAINTISGC